MSLRTGLIDFFYKTATGSRRVRTLLTPIGAVFFLSFTALFIVISLYVDSRLCLPELLSEPLNIIMSLPILLPGMFITAWSVQSFFKAKGTPVPFNPPPGLVTAGPYAYVRNPMLTGVFILLFGLGVLFRSPLLVFLFTPLFILISIWGLKKIEEPELARRLGKEYIEYKKRTPMFIPDLEIKLRNKS